MGTRTAHTVTFCDSSYRGYPGTAPAVGETSARTRFTSRFMTVILESAKSKGIFPLVTQRMVYMWSASQTPPSTIRTSSPPPPNYSTICEQKEGARLLPNPLRPRIRKPCFTPSPCPSCPSCPSQTFGDESAPESPESPAPAPPPSIPPYREGF